MRYEDRVGTDKFTNIDYHHFTKSPSLKFTMKVLGILTWPIILPMAYLSKGSDFIFRTCSEILAIVPFVVGAIMRSEFYSFTLTKFGENVLIGFGTIFFYRDIEIGDNVTIGNYNIFHYCNLGSYVLCADHCQYLSGTKYHNYSRTDIPMALQGGKIRRITIGDDCWVGAGSIIMNNVNKGSIVGAGSIVRDTFESYTILSGNPAKIIKKRNSTS